MAGGTANLVPHLMDDIVCLCVCVCVVSFGCWFPPSWFFPINLVVPHDCGIVLGLGPYHIGCGCGVGGDAPFQFAVVCLAARSARARHRFSGWGLPDVDAGCPLFGWRRC